ncbi:MAG: zinc-dependent peptidase [Phycisphaerales bacterium]|nr:zinc-dependent peptidase [Phycisphaerales bacterium]
MPILRLMRWLGGGKRRRRARLATRPFPPAWRGIIERRVGLWRRLPPADRLELLRHVLIFLNEKGFEGCGGMVIDDEVRLTIAAQACILLLHRETDYFPALRSILVYPDEYLAPAAEQHESGIVIEDHEPRAGESWAEGSLVLSWRDVVEGSADSQSGENVVLHEFAHQIDDEWGLSSAEPEEQPEGDAREWARVFREAFERHRRDVKRGRSTVVDSYGATDEAEFFAVVTETFFEQPAELRIAEPELYRQWSKFFRQDPLAWSDRGAQAM